MSIKKIWDYQKIIDHILLTDYCNLDKWIWDQWSWAFSWMGPKRREACAISCWYTDFWSQHNVWYATFSLLLVVIFIIIWGSGKVHALVGKPCYLDSFGICIIWVGSCKLHSEEEGIGINFFNLDKIGAPARTVGWRDPGYIHTSFLKDLWPNREYVVS